MNVFSKDDIFVVTSNLTNYCSHHYNADPVTDNKMHYVKKSYFIES